MVHGFLEEPKDVIEKGFHPKHVIYSVSIRIEFKIDIKLTNNKL